MRGRSAAVLAAVVAAAAGIAPAAHAATFTVTGTGDSPGVCNPGGECPSLRAALTSASANLQPDTILFSTAISGATITAASTLQGPSDGAVEIDGGGDTTVAQAPSAAGPLLRFPAESAGSRVRNITLAGPGAGKPGATSLISTVASDMTIQDSTLRNAATSGVSIGDDAQRVRVTRNQIYGFGTVAIAHDSAGVNGGIQSPQGFRVGPRQPDGTLPITGSTGTGGSLEVFLGAQQPFAYAFGLPAGAFSVLPEQEPPPGEPIAATITDDAGNTSEYTATRVPDDVVSPFLVGAVATSLSTVDVQPSEPVDGQTIQPTDFAVTMAGVNRTVLGASASPDGTRITLFLDGGWDAGEAGSMRTLAPGAFNDTSGNFSQAPVQLHVGGAPGDFIAPVITNFRLNPTRGVCWVAGPRCKRERTAIIFRSSEDGDTFITVFRGSRRIGERRYTGQPGSNYVRFDGKIRGRRLRPGLYSMRVAMEDEVGNRLPLDQQPRASFRVKNTRSR